MVDPFEDISTAAVREVREETGIDASFRSIECFRATHDGLDGQTNLYFIVSLTPRTNDIHVQESEIAAGCWMPMAKFLQHEFTGVYGALHEIAAQNHAASTAGAANMGWIEHKLPIVFRKGVNTLYCSPDCVLSEKCTGAKL